MLDQGYHRILTPKKENYKLGSLSSLFYLADEHPRLLPVAINYLYTLKIYGYVRPDNNFSVMKIDGEDNNIILSLDPELLAKISHRYPKHEIISLKGNEIIDILVESNQSEKTLGAIVLHDYNNQPSGLHLSSRLFHFASNESQVFRIDNNPNQLSRETLAELKFFFQMYPEIKSVHYVSLYQGQNRKNALIIQGDEPSLSSGFILTVPKLIMEKQGFRRKSLDVTYKIIAEGDLSSAFQVYKRN